MEHSGNELNDDLTTYLGIKIVAKRDAYIQVTAATVVPNSSLLSPEKALSLLPLCQSRSHLCAAKTYVVNLDRRLNAGSRAEECFQEQEWSRDLILKGSRQSTEQQ